MSTPTYLHLRGIAEPIELHEFLGGTNLIKGHGRLWRVKHVVCRPLHAGVD